MTWSSSRVVLIGAATCCLAGCASTKGDTVYVLEGRITNTANGSGVDSVRILKGEGRWREYEGGVEDWLVQSARTAAIQNASKSGAIKDQAMLGTSQKDPQAAAKATPAPAKLSYKDQRELDALPGRIEALEKEQQALRDELANGTIYSRDAQRATARHARDAAIDEELMAALERWEALSSR